MDDITVDAKVHTQKAEPIGSDKNSRKGTSKPSKSIKPKSHGRRHVLGRHRRSTASLFPSSESNFSGYSTAAQVLILTRLALRVRKTRVND